MARKSSWLIVFVLICVILQSWVAGAGELNYTYDAFRRLERVERPGHYRIDYAYDAAGNRTSVVTTLSGPSYDSEPDGDVDGYDLALFAQNWDGTGASLAGFAAVFGFVD